MTDTQEAPAEEPTIEERVRARLANFLDDVAHDEAPGMTWSITTLAVMLRPVLTDLDRHLRAPMPSMPQLERPEPSAEAIRRRELIREEEQRHTWTGAELAEAIREDM